jgi:propionate CoA-transferase
MGVEAGAGTNYMAMIDQPYQFDFYDGGGLDLAFLSFAELDAEGNINVSRFGDRVIGFGGFINISQGAAKVVFSGTFTAGGLKLDLSNGSVAIAQEGRSRKLVERVNQISYAAAYARERGQRALYVTERAVFRPVEGGLELIEIAPGLDLERDILGLMDFKPAISPNLKQMDAALFRPEPVGLSALLATRPRVIRSKRIAERAAANAG